MNSIGIRFCPCGRSANDGSGPESPMSAAKPRPRRGRISSAMNGPFKELSGAQATLTLNNFRRKFEIGLATSAFQVVKKHRLPVGRSLGYSDIARDYRFID